MKRSGSESRNIKGCFLGADGSGKRSNQRSRSTRGTRSVINKAEIDHNPKIQPKLEKGLLSPTDLTEVQKCYLAGPLNIDKSTLSIIDLLPQHMHICPIVGIDFSLGNLTFSSNGTSVHTPNVGKANQYRDLI